MKVLVTGVKGQLGFDVVRVCSARNIDAVGVDIDEMDITDIEQVEKTIASDSYDAVIHCAAYTAVDAAEDNEELCRKVNAYGTENIAKCCQKYDIKLMYFSTDYVFNGKGTCPWKETDAPEPLNVYGLTKYEGEQAVRRFQKKHFILRISWVFGLNGKNFVKTMLQLGQKNTTINVVNDQIGSPTYTYDLARLVVDMIQTDKYGTYHVTNEGDCSWYDFACEIFRLKDMNVRVNPVDSSQYPTKASRPQNSRMSKEKIRTEGFKPLPLWQDALTRYLNELEE